jgi:hypothetical protein
MQQKILDLILALNIQGLDISFTKTSSFNRVTKMLYFTYRITIWEKKVVNHKAKHFPIFNKTYKRLTDIVIFLAKLVNNDDVDSVIKGELQDGVTL